jgi:phosphoenolpyruvate carboxylase
MRKIPGTMATQHPDNAFAPYWDKDGSKFVGTYQEIQEAVACFKDLNVSEYMWDWEGKHADAAVIDRLFSEYYEYFKKNNLGRDKFLTFRIPNMWEEKGYNLLQAMSVVLSGEDFARDLGFSGRPLFEVILPMTVKATQLMHMHRLYEKLSQFKSNDFTPEQSPNSDYLELIPLVESVNSQLSIKNLLKEYTNLHREHFKSKPSYIRPFLACSDSALSSGFLAAIIGNKLALTRLYEFQTENNLEVYPILGSGSLPFRGGVAPKTVDRLVKEMPGIRTVSIQSSFRYDHPQHEVKRAISQLELVLPKAKPLAITQPDQILLESIADISSKFYTDAIESLAEDMQPFFKAVPKRRDRRQHIGLLSYGRTMGKQSLPRAITFTAAFYSIGIPPEFIGLGRTLKNLKHQKLEALFKNYDSLRNDITLAGNYLNKANLDILAKDSLTWKEVQDDVNLTSTLLNVNFEALTNNQKAHQQLTSAALTLRDEPQMLGVLISRMAELRKSLG